MNTNNIENALLMLVITIIIIILISFLYQKNNIIQISNIFNNNYSNSTESLETFVNYQDVKTKTLNWCDKMHNVGLLTSEQFDECVSTFKDATSGILPKEFKSPSTGMSRNYSLYNTRVKELTSNIAGENGNTVMLVNNTGLYMGCKVDNSIYFVSNINDSNVNQKEIIFTLLPQTNNVYIIMSPYGKYLIVNSGSFTIANAEDTIKNTISDVPIPTLQSSRQDWCANFTGKSMGTMTSWNVKTLDTDNHNNSRVTFESIQLNNFFLSSNQNNQDSSLYINYGSDDVNIWTMIPQKKSKTNNNTVDKSTEYIVKRDNILMSIAITKSQIIYLNIFKDSLNKLQDIIKTNYSNIENYVIQIMNNQVPNIPIDSTQSTPKYETITVSENDKNTFISNITRMKQDYINQINIDISTININLTSLQTKSDELDLEYIRFLNDVSNKLSEINSKIEQNNVIMNRQTNDYDKLNNDYSYINDKKTKNDKLDEVSKLNTDLISKYSNNNYMLVKVYPFVIFILFICLIYLGYLTYKKFMENVFHHYSI